MTQSNPVSALTRRNTRKVSHLLADDLRRQILTGGLAADERLPTEADLMAQFEVSRDTLREALRILESQSLLEVRRGRGGGAVVRRPGLDAVSRYVGMLLQLRGATLSHVEEARSVIEPSAAEQTAVRATAADLERLAALHAAERSPGNDLLGFVSAVADFDQAVMELSGNPSLSVLAGVFRDIHAGQVYAGISTADAAAAERIARRVIISHSGFLDTARRHDGGLAGNTWRDYLYTTNRVLVSRTNSRQPIDLSPLWRARAAQAGSAPRRSLAVAAEIRAKIAEGTLREDDRLAPLAELAAEFGISRPTLREALRILEMEYLLELRTGDRAGARIREPTTQVAAQLAGIVLEARQTTLGDFHRASRLIQPRIVELVAVRAGTRDVRRLTSFDAELAAAVTDTARFVSTIQTAELALFSATRNPALTVIAEILHWVRRAVRPVVTADAAALPFVTKTNRKAHRHFSQLLTAIAAQDASAARDAWLAFIDVGAPFLEDSDLGARLIIDLLG